MSRIQLNHMHFFASRLFHYIDETLLLFNIDYEIFFAENVGRGDFEIASLRDGLEE